ncbi:MAG: hypothetical protein E7231_15705 [Cellulosilyticum sp.]|nr:hypothetical protein [Cellulosilyticum sp.]
MFIKDDCTYRQMKQDSTMQWLESLLQSEDVVNRQGAKVTIEHIESLNRKIKELEERNALKDEYLKKLKQKIK